MHMCRPHDREDGVTLVEMLISIVVLGIVLLGLASVVMAALRVTVTNEQEVRATAAASRAIEELQTIAWDNAALYENETSAADARWTDRLSDDGFDGMDLVTLPAPSEADARVPQVPEPSGTLDAGNDTYTIDRYVHWVDRDGDGTDDTKRFTIFVTWESTGNQRTFSASAERAPTQGEAAATVDGTRVVQFTASPKPAFLDDDNRTDEQTFIVKLNRPATNGKLAYYAVDGDGNPQMHEVAMSGSSTDPAGGVGYTTWELTIPAGQHRYAEGVTDVRFTATDSAATTVEGFGGVEYRGGDLDGPLPRPDSTVSDEEPWLGEPDPTETPTDGGTETPTDGETDPPVTETTVNNVTTSSGQLCIDNGQQTISADFTVTVTASGLTETDGQVEVTYEAWTDKKTTGNNAGERTVRTRHAEYVSGGAGNSTWEMTLAANEDIIFQPGESVTFTVDARNGTDGNDGGSTSPVTVATC